MTTLADVIATAERAACELPGDDGIPDDQRLVMSIADFRVIVERAIEEALLRHPPDVGALRKGIEEIAAQKLSSEMDEDIYDQANFEDGYDLAVECARQALSGARDIAVWNRRAPDLAEALRKALLDLPDDILWYLDEMDDEEARELANAVRRARAAFASLSRPSVMANRDAVIEECIGEVQEHIDMFMGHAKIASETTAIEALESILTRLTELRALSASPSPAIGQEK